uniref:DUF7869 domain-containing protein n=1 Tax=Trichogramma kaykai TaxID=54128 RepID=A0ABD2W2F8_9HYME
MSDESEEFSEITDDSDIAETEKQQPQCSNPNIKNMKTSNARKKIDRPETSRARKRKSNTDNWIDVQAKKARSSGVAGISRTGVPFKSKAMKAGCGKNIDKCHRFIDMDDRNNAYQIYWNLKDQQSKWQCILNWIKLRKERPLSSDDTDSSDDENLTTTNSRIMYRLPKIETLELVKVCRTMFLHTLAISKQTAITERNKNIASNGTGVAGIDNRGRHGNHPHKYPEAIINVIKEHIKNFPVVESHYARANTAKQYLPEGLNYPKMLRLLMVQLDAAGIKNLRISRQIYRKTMIENFNYGFFKPKNDKCEFCERYKNSNFAEKRKLKSDWKSHLNNKKRARKFMREATKKAKSDKSLLVLHFDLQKVLTTPKAQVSNMYYMSRVSIFNLTLYDLARRNETKPKIKEINTFSDNCGGQNKNLNVFSMMLTFAVLHNVKIIHRFLEVGQTQSAGDSMHANIESYTKQKEIFTQEQWGKAMQASCHKKPYVVNHVAQKEIIDFTKLSDTLM